jgi:hypothetical protein
VTGGVTKQAGNGVGAVLIEFLGGSILIGGAGEQNTAASLEYVLLHDLVMA